MRDFTVIYLMCILIMHKADFISLQKGIFKIIRLYNVSHD